MEENENTLEKAVGAIKNEQIPPGPPQELIESTIIKLAETTGQADTVKLDNRIRTIKGLKAAKRLIKIAVAAALLIAAGYATGRLSGPKPPDMQQLQAALEPAIRQRLLDETKQYVQLGLANGYLRIQDELSQQYRQELSRVALQAVAASNAVTNELLIELIASFNEVQSQYRQQVAVALNQIESNRLKDRNELSDAFTTFAVLTEDELIRTNQNMAHVLSYTQLGRQSPEEFRNPDNLFERTEK
ncbi:MAG TPA: hypothetical protein VMX36_10445 [Sedimentisphaerales bacterium]|nr:hypothetical protein [Sedimentisphaerales bacterium]